MRTRKLYTRVSRILGGRVLPHCLALCCLSLVLSAANTAVAMSPSDGTAVEATPHSEDTGLAITGLGILAEQLAADVLDRVPDLERNPYALLVSFTPDADPEKVTAILDSVNGRLVHRYGDTDQYLLEISSNLEYSRAALLQHPVVVDVNFDTVIKLASWSNDPQADDLWGLFDTHGISAPAAWDAALDAEDVVVAVIDTGVNTAHPDLAGRIWTNPDEIADNGIDDDGNGYIDDINGWDFVEDDAVPNDPNGHGTHVSGTIAAVRNNETGIAGVADNARIMALRFLNANGSGYISDALVALEYAVDNNAPISNNSWGGGGYSSAFSDMLDQAASNGHVFVAAAGNSAQDIDAYVSYPAGYSHPNILSVAAHGPTGVLASFSNYGITSVDISAPGVSILSSVSSSGYAYYSGTSMAAPHAAGVAAMLLGLNSSLSPVELIDHILVGGRRSAAFGSLRSGAALDAFGALQSADPDTPIVTISGAPSSGLIETGQPISLTASALSSEGVNLSPAIIWSDANGTEVGTGPSFTTTAGASGVFVIYAEVSDTAGRLGRATIQLTVFTPRVEFLSPAEDVLLSSGETLQISWDWNGNDAATGDLYLTSLLRAVAEPTAPDNAISDHATTIVPIHVDAGIPVEELIVGLRVDHTYLWDLTVSLVSPLGTEVQLVQRRGSSGDNFGTSGTDCSADLTTFSDSSERQISSGTAPFSGSWQPEQPLSAFSGESATGLWQLRISDNATHDSGTVYCVSLEFSGEEAANELVADVLLSDESLSVPHDSLIGVAVDKMSKLLMTGESFASATSAGLIVISMPPQPPNTPTSVVAAAGDKLATVTWDPPVDYDQTPITGYTVVTATGSNSCSWSPGPLECEVTGLTNGVPYTFTVTATNDVGHSEPSLPSAVVIPFSVDIDEITLANDGTLSWRTLTDNAAVIGYEVQYRLGSDPLSSNTHDEAEWNEITIETSSTSPSVELEGTEPGAVHSIRITVVTDQGSVPFSSREVTAAVLEPPVVVASAPMNVTTVPGRGQVTVSWRAPTDNGGAQIIGYTVSTNPGARICTTIETLCVVDGLTSGKAYSFTVVATNSAGNSEPSSPVTSTLTLIRQLEEIGVDCTVAQPHPFTDVVTNSYAYGPVGCIYNLGVTKGISPTEYGPANTVTRAQMATFLARFYNTLTS